MFVKQHDLIKSKIGGNTSLVLTVNIHKNPHRHTNTDIYTHRRTHKIIVGAMNEKTDA